MTTTLSQPLAGTKTREEPYIAAAILFLACAALLAFPWLSGRVTIPWDAKAHFQPQFAFLAHALHSGQSPFWTPNVFAGMPQIADPQSLIFSPFFLIAAALVPEPSFILEDAIVFAMLAMGALALIAYFRDRGWSAAGALLAAFAFAYGGSAAWRIQHTGQIMSFSWLPVTLWLLARALDRRSAAYGAAAGAVAAFMVLGRDQIAFLGVLHARGLCALSRGDGRRARDDGARAIALRRPRRRRHHRRAAGLHAGACRAFQPAGDRP